jgi:hypothetical protein
MSISSSVSFYELSPAAVRHTPTTIVPGEAKPGKAEGRHHLRQILGHGPFGVGEMLDIWLGGGAVAIAAQIREHAGKRWASVGAS